jgi:hypothetical protein
VPCVTLVKRDGAYLQENFLNILEYALPARWFAGAFVIDPNYQSLWV